jgi:hypothetical protein
MARKSIIFVFIYSVAIESEMLEMKNSIKFNSLILWLRTVSPEKRGGLSRLYRQQKIKS